MKEIQSNQTIYSLDELFKCKELFSLLNINQVVAVKEKQKELERERKHLFSHNYFLNRRPVEVNHFLDCRDIKYF